MLVIHDAIKQSKISKMNIINYIQFFFANIVSFYLKLTIQFFYTVKIFEKVHQVFLFVTKTKINKE